MASDERLFALLLALVHNAAPRSTGEGLAVKRRTGGRLRLRGQVDIREGTRLNLALTLFRGLVPGVDIDSTRVKFVIPQVRLGDVTSAFERKVLSERCSGKYADPKSCVALPEWNTRFVDAADRRYAPMNVQPRYCVADDAATISEVARLVARHCTRIVVHTGAGISSNAGLSTFREGGAGKSISVSAAMPTYTHYALVRLVREGKVAHVCSQNFDGLLRRAGLAPDRLSDLHGNAYVETCSCCSPAKEFLRPFEVMEVKDRNARYWARYLGEPGASQIEANAELSDNERRSGFHHLTGRACPVAHGPLRDTIIHFNEDLSAERLRRAERWSAEASLNLVLGSSLLVTPACDLPFRGTGPVVVVSKSCTGGDGLALQTGGALLHADVDAFMEQVMRHLGIDFPNTEAHLRWLAAGVRARDEQVLRSLQAEGMDLWDPRIERKQKKAEAMKAAAEREGAASAAEEMLAQKEVPRSGRPVLEVPNPAGYKEALVRLRASAGEAFLKRHGLKDLSRNKLAKKKYCEFCAMFQDFLNTATDPELHKYEGEP